MEKPRKFHSLDQLGGLIPSNEKNSTENGDMPFDSYEEYTKYKLRKRWKELRERSGRLVDNIYSKSNKRPTWNQDFIKAEVKRLEEKEKQGKDMVSLNNKNTLAGVSNYALTYTSGASINQTDNGIISPSSMPEKNTATERKVKSTEAKLGSEDLKLQKAVYTLSRKIEDKLKEVTGDKRINERNKRDLENFRSSPYRWMKMIFNKNIAEAEENLHRIKDKDKRAQIERDLEENEKELKILINAFEKNVPLKLNNTFTESEVDLGGNEILNIKQSKEELGKYLGGKNTEYKIKGVIQRQYADLLVLETESGEVELDLDIARKIFLKNKESRRNRLNNIKEGDTIEITTGDIKSKKLRYKIIKKTKDEIIFEDLNANNKTVIATMRSLDDMLLNPKNDFIIEIPKKIEKEVEVIKTEELPVVASEEKVEPKPEESKKFENIMKEIEELRIKRKALEEEIQKAKAFIPKLEDTSRLIRDKSIPENSTMENEIEDIVPTPPKVESNMDNIKVHPVHREYVEANSTGVRELVKEKEPEPDNNPEPEKEETPEEIFNEAPAIETTEGVEGKAKEAGNVFHGDYLKEELREVLIEKGFNIRDVDFDLAPSAFIIKGRTKNKEISIELRDTGGTQGLIARKDRINVGGGALLGILPGKKARGEANFIADNIMQGIKEHFERKTGKVIESIHYSESRLTLNFKE
jgi:hypothetical protein